MLDDIKLKDSYSSDDDDIIKDFYNPVLERSIHYDRITGYFSPGILALAARGFAGLVNNGGRIRILSSVKVSEETYAAIKNSASYEMDTDVFSGLGFNPEYLQNELQKDYLRVFMYLYKTGLLEMKIAILRDNGGILHQKVGIARDVSGNALSFSGSNNETIGGALNNLEEFKVFKNWTISSSSYFANDEAKFEKYWNNKVDGVRVIEISKAVRSELVTISDTPEDIKGVIRRINDLELQPEAPTKLSRRLRHYQIDAIDHWVSNGYRSIFEMATGTGKTFTAISALRKFRDDKGYLRVIVVVPLTTLTIQWQDDIKKIIPDITIINTSLNTKWKEELNSLTFSSQLGRGANYIVITTYSMFSKPDFGERISKLGDDDVLLADEMHNLVNKNRIEVLNNTCYKYRLGLSATPTRLWQQAESAIARLHFGNNSYQYSLKDAIDNGFLVHYRYHPVTVRLSAEEYEEYLSLSREISRLSQFKSKDDGENTSLNMKLIARSRVKKNAENKVLSLSRALKEMLREDSLYDALIYVDNEEFLKVIQAMLTESSVRTTKFTGASALEDRLSAIRNLRTHAINAIVAIKCLDEGVDIPSAKMAFFLSNNTDPREYVQRLGRVLRLDEESQKNSSDIYDFIVVPPSGLEYEGETDRRIARNMIKNELIRAKFFNELAVNSEQSQDIIDDSVDEYGFYYEENELIYNIGDEDNELTY